MKNTWENGEFIGFISPNLGNIEKTREKNDDL
jgi:hypothetical protein